LAGHIRATHIHDNDGRRDQHLPPPSGSIGWREVVRAFHEAGCTLLVYEFGGLEHQSPLNAVETLRLVTGYLRSLL